MQDYQINLSHFDWKIKQMVHIEGTITFGLTV